MARPNLSPWTLLLVVVGVGCAGAVPSSDAADRSATGGAPASAGSDALLWPIEGANPTWLSSTFGPRLKASEGYRYDFHRGIDIPAPHGTAVYAVAAGEVRIAGEHEAYEDALVQVRHMRGGATRCSDHAEGCFYSNYMHLSKWVVSVGDHVERGQLLGYSGSSTSGFEHLHFEIRSGGVYQQHAIHPLRMLPYEDRGVEMVWIGADMHSHGSNQDAVVHLEADRSELDLTSITVRVIDATDDRVVDTRAFPMEDWNRAWTHRPEEWPASVCPKRHEHGDSAHYDANVHTDNPTFNGLRIAPARFNAASDTYGLELTFEGLNATRYDDGAELEVELTDARGNVQLARLP